MSVIGRGVTSFIGCRLKGKDIALLRCWEGFGAQRRSQIPSTRAPEKATVGDGKSLARLGSILKNFFAKKRLALFYTST